MPEASSSSVMEQIVSLCKRRGFIYPASEIYGGLNGFWDYGPLGVLLKNNIRDWWWRNMVECPPVGPDGHPVDMVGVDTAIVQNPKTWVASGHVGGFSDPMVDDRETKQRYRADHLLTATGKVKRKNGNVDELGVFAVLSGDEAVANFVKRVDKLARKTGGGEVVAPEYGEFVPRTKFSPGQQGKGTRPEPTAPRTPTQPRDLNPMVPTYGGGLHDEAA